MDQGMVSMFGGEVGSEMSSASHVVTTFTIEFASQELGTKIDLGFKDCQPLLNSVSKQASTFLVIEQKEEPSLCIQSKGGL